MVSPHPVPAGPPPTVTELRVRTVFRVPPTTGSASPTVSATPPGDSASSSGGASLLQTACGIHACAYMQPHGWRSVPDDTLGLAVCHKGTVEMSPI
jgi:hypothetical protein